MENKTLLNTREVAQLLDINEKMVYTLISEKELPATKATGKWLFPVHLVERWVENQTINYPKEGIPLPPYHGLLIIVGSNDILLDRTISLFNRACKDHVAVFGNVGSMGGIKALGRDLCHMAASHLLQEDEQEYNFDFITEKFGGEAPVLVNFCRREQGLIVAKGNPKGISSISDLGQAGIKIANRPEGTGTRLLLDRELVVLGAEVVVIQAGFDVGQIRLDGYPRSSAKTSHPGVIINFDSKYGPLRYVCDTFSGSRAWIPAERRRGERGGYRDMLGYQANIRAIALGLEALRKVDRYGITKTGEQYTGWRQLTAGSGLTTVAKAKRLIKEWANLDGVEDMELLVKKALTTSHPDHGGTDEAFQSVMDARKLLATFDS